MFWNKSQFKICKLGKFCIIEIFCPNNINNNITQLLLVVRLWLFASKNKSFNKIAPFQLPSLHDFFRNCLLWSLWLYLHTLVGQLNEVLGQIWPTDLEFDMFVLDKRFFSWKLFKQTTLVQSSDCVVMELTWDLQSLRWSSWAFVFSLSIAQSDFEVNFLGRRVLTRLTVIGCEYSHLWVIFLAVERWNPDCWEIILQAFPDWCTATSVASQSPLLMSFSVGIVLTPTWMLQTSKLTKHLRT